MPGRAGVAKVTTQVVDLPAAFFAPARKSRTRHDGRSADAQLVGKGLAFALSPYQRRARSFRTMAADVVVVSATKPGQTVAAALGGGPGDCATKGGSMKIDITPVLVALILAVAAVAVAAILKPARYVPVGVGDQSEGARGFRLDTKTGMVQAGPF